jgi:hypothetical protein
MIAVPPRLRHLGRARWPLPKDFAGVARGRRTLLTQLAARYPASGSRERRRERRHGQEINRVRRRTPGSTLCCGSPSREVERSAQLAFAATAGARRLSRASRSGGARLYHARHRRSLDWCTPQGMISTTSVQGSADFTAGVRPRTALARIRPRKRQSRPSVWRLTVGAGKKITGSHRLLPRQRTSSILPSRRQLMEDRGSSGLGGVRGHALPRRW